MRIYSTENSEERASLADGMVSAMARREIAFQAQTAHRISMPIRQ
jgi:hypothetical protein